MKLYTLSFTILFTLLWVIFYIRPLQAANAIVGDGTPASCTEAAFDSALANVQADEAGIITFNCGHSSYTIEYDAAITIEPPVR